MSELVEVLFEDELILAVNKPSGMLVHKGWAKDGILLVNVVKKYLGQAKSYPIHRIDRATSGVVLFAKSSEMAAKLNLLFSEQMIEKSYLAFVRGKCPDHGIIDYPIPGKINGERKQAITHYQRLAWRDIKPRELSLVRATPKTGRLHQIRRHLKHIRHPLICDSNYGDTKLNREFTASYQLKRLALHAESLSFIHPTKNTKICIKVKIPDDLLIPMLKMGFDESCL